MASSNRVVVHGSALRAIMRNERSQELVNKVANNIAEYANSTMSPSLSDRSVGYVVHPRVLTVSAHAFVDCGDYLAMIDTSKYDTLARAFWFEQGA